MAPPFRLLLPVLTGIALTALALPARGELGLTPCRILGADKTRQQSARCGTLTVPLDYDAPNGKTIDLFVAVVPARSRKPAADALTVIAGGPGAASTAFYADRALSFHFANKTRDVVLVDQRGTGQSNPLNCPHPQELAIDQEWSLELVRQMSKDCLASLKSDTRFFTTSVAVKDLESLRTALGYQQLSIYGASYGTRVALHYLRRYPESTRAVIVDGVLAPDTMLVPGIPKHAQRALDKIFARCSNNEACSARFPDAAGEFAALYDMLRNDPARLTVDDPHTGEPVELNLSHLELGGIVRILSYSPETAALLPMLVTNAANGDLEPLAAQMLIALQGVGEALSYGMHNAVACSEDAPRLAGVPGSHFDDLDETYLGRWFVDGFAAACESWPRGVVDNDFHDPVLSDLPVLLLSGGTDPATPAENADRVAESLDNSIHLVQPDHGHGLLTLPCVARLMGAFVETPDPESLDTACMSKQQPPPFFIDFSGPEP